MKEETQNKKIKAKKKKKKKSYDRRIIRGY